MTAPTADKPGGLKIRTLIRRRWPLAAAGVALLILLAAVVWWRGGGGILGSDGTPSLRDVLNPLSLFDERSPGDRADGSLLATKQGKGRVNPVEFAMGTGRQRAPMMPEGAAPAPASPELTPESFAASDVPVSVIPEEAILASPEGPPVGLDNPGVIIPIGSVPDVSFPPTLPPGTPPVCCTGPPGTPPAIPEPATWLMMIVGFFMVGVALRARPNRAPAVARSESERR